MLIAVTQSDRENWGESLGRTLLALQWAVLFVLLSMCLSSSPKEKYPVSSQ